MDAATLAERPDPARASDEAAHRRLVRSLLLACIAAGSWLVLRGP